MTLLPVKPFIDQAGRGRPRNLPADSATALPAQAAHFEQIGKIAVEQKREAQIHRPLTIVADDKTLVRGIAQQKDGAHHMQRVFREDEPIFVIRIGIGEINAQQRVVVADVRAKRQGLRAVEQEFEMREKARVAVEQAVGAAGGSTDIAVAVEHDKGIIVLEHIARPGRRSRCGNIERRLGNIIVQQFRERGALGRHAVPVSSFPVPAPAAAGAGWRPAPRAMSS